MHAKFLDLGASLKYFGLVFSAGLLLGMVRVPLVVPRLGVRAAELLEMPLMLLVIVLAARFVVRHRGRVRQSTWLLIGFGSFALAVGAELVVATLLQQQSPAQYVASRDPISGTAYLALLVVFALMPAWVSRRSR